MNIAAVNVSVQVSAQVSAFNYFGYIFMEIELLAHMAILCLIFGGSAITIFNSAFLKTTSCRIMVLSW